VYGKGLAESRTPAARAGRRADVGRATKVEIELLIELAGEHCEYCGEPWTERGGLNIDHVVPLTPRKGEPKGTGWIENLAAVCFKCNISKGNLPLDVWLARCAKLLPSG